jgi:hypothetical protein
VKGVKGRVLAATIAAAGTLAESTIEKRLPI